MDFLTHFLLDYVYWGMFVSAFLAGSFLPFRSEAVLLGLMAAGLPPIPLVIYGTIGNVLGSMFNYWVGRMGKMEWIERYLHVKRESVEKTQRFMSTRGTWMGFFAFVPFVGSAITVVLGLTRANIFLSIFYITLGKIVRYIILLEGVNLLV